MSRKPAIIKVVNLEDGMPKVEQARLRMQHELALARSQGVVAVKLIHGYGSSGTGGALRNELQKELRSAGTARERSPASSPAKNGPSQTKPRGLC